jgi:hypothetical protein
MKTPLPAMDEAAALACAVAAWLVRDEGRRQRFLALTGMDLPALRAGLEDPGVQAAVLEYLLADESLLLTFTSEENVPPDLPRLAWMRLTGPEHDPLR